MSFGATILDAQGHRLTQDEKALFRRANPYGFILFARNLDSHDQIRALCQDMRDAVGRNAPILIDQEGGRVQRLRPPLATKWTPPLDFARAAQKAQEHQGEHKHGHKHGHHGEQPGQQIDHSVGSTRIGPETDNVREAMYLRYRLIAAELFDLGIDVNCAPMVDVPRAHTHDFLTDRCYGDTPALAAQLGRAVARGLLDGGVIPVVKHIPGHGLATADSHHDLPRVAAARDELDRIDFAPFKALNDVPMGMTAHIVYESIDQAPATLSPRAVQVIRNDIGFDNLLMTDDISMKALSGSLTDITRGALAAGCDVVLLCNADLADRTAVAEAAGPMNAAAQARAERALLARKPPMELDIHAAKERLKTLFGGPYV